MIRVGLTYVASRRLARAVTIATRYSVVRRQTQNRPGYAQVVLYLETFTIFSNIDCHVYYI